MKKILSVLCALAFIASFACIGASAADVAATFSLVANPVEEGATELTADLVVSIPEGGDVTQLAVFVDYDEAALDLKAATKVYASGMFQTSQTVDVKPYMMLWIEGTASLPAGDNVIATITFDILGETTVGTTYDLDLALDPNNMPASTQTVEYTEDQLVVNGTTAEVVAATVITTTEAPVTTVATTTEEVTTAATTTEATEATEATTTEATTTEATETETESTKAPDKSTQTGDMMFVVVAVMVVALGAAVVVKKVNVK